MYFCGTTKNQSSIALLVSLILTPSYWYISKRRRFSCENPNSSVYLKRHAKGLKLVIKEIWREEENKTQKKKYNNEFWKAVFISQNIEYNKKIFNSRKKIRRSQHIRKPNSNCFDIDLKYRVRTKLITGMICIWLFSAKQLYLMIELPRVNY